MTQFKFPKDSGTKIVVYPKVTTIVAIMCFYKATKTTMSYSHKAYRESFQDQESIGVDVLAEWIGAYYQSKKEERQIAEATRPSAWPVVWPQKEASKDGSEFMVNYHHCKLNRLDADGLETWKGLYHNSGRYRPLPSVTPK